MKHGLHSGWVAINEKKGEQIGETMMDLACRLILASHLQTNHLRELTRQRIANDGDNTHCST